MIDYKKIKITLIIALLSISNSYCAQQPTGQPIAYIDFFKKNIATLAPYKTAFVVAGCSVGVAAYLGHIFWLDAVVNSQKSVWHWALHHMQDGTINQDELMVYIQQQYADLYARHPLTAVFALAHDTQAEIETCLTLRACLNFLRMICLDGLTIETTCSLDKKLEQLYMLKISLAQCVTETRSRCRKNVSLYQ